MRHLKLIQYLIITATFFCCTIHIPNNESNNISYDNIMIYVDLSDRMKKNPSDTLIINQILDFFVMDCVKPGIKWNDQSAISFSRINHQGSKCSSSKIDIDQFKNLEEKQQFVNDKIKNGGLSKSIIDFKRNIRCNYEESDKGGLDILSLIYREVNSGNHIKKTKYLNYERDTTMVNFRNHLVIFTDGYLEYSQKEGSPDFYFGTREIEKLRGFCKVNNISPEEAIKNNPKFGVRPLVSDYNKLVNLYILETDDRGFNPEKGTLKNTGELSDNNILRIVWKIWAQESGFKSFEWKQLTTGSNLAPDYISKMFKR